MPDCGLGLKWRRSIHLREQDEYVVRRFQRRSPGKGRFRSAGKLSRVKINRLFRIHRIQMKMVKGWHAQRLRLSVEQSRKYDTSDQKFDFHFFTYRFRARGPTSAP